MKRLLVIHSIIAVAIWSMLLWALQLKNLTTLQYWFFYATIVVIYSLIVAIILVKKQLKK